ncbi:MAG: hypothetical protein PHW73_08990 [Atribacterota bacterium]|nr:hypothetical protein [Atribacterota bacterium]
MKKGYSNKWQWYNYAQSYFLLAHLACQYLSDSNKKYSKAIGSEEVFSSLKYNNRDLIIPVIYNIKHGIESFLKGIMKQLNIPLPHQENKGSKGHDIVYLYEKIVNHEVMNKKPDLFYRFQCMECIIYKWSNLVGKVDSKNEYFRYNENLKGYIMLTQKDIDKIATKNFLKDLRKDLVIFYKSFNEIGDLIWNLKNR